MWCKAYKFMLDSPNDRRFFLTDSTAGVIELAKSASLKNSPCVIMESTVEGGGKLKRPSRNYPIYFFVRAKKAADGDAAALAKEEAWMHAQNFTSWLLAQREKALEENRDNDFSRINLDDAYLDIQTIGPLENAWFAVMIQFEREEPLNLCIDDSLYVADCDCDCEE
jgi:hypothetical protein